MVFWLRAVWDVPTDQRPLMTIVCWRCARKQGKATLGISTIPTEQSWPIFDPYLYKVRSCFETTAFCVKAECEWVLPSSKSHLFLNLHACMQASITTVTSMLLALLFMFFGGLLDCLFLHSFVHSLFTRFCIRRSSSCHSVATKSWVSHAGRVCPRICHWQPRWPSGDGTHGGATNKQSQLYFNHQGSGGVT